MLPGRACPFTIIMGTSVGAINAVALASQARNFKRGAARIARLWSTLETSRIYRTDAPANLLSGARWLLSLTPLGALGLGHPRSIFDNAPLRQLVESRIDFARIEKNIRDGVLRAVGVTAASYSEGCAVTFVQGEDGVGSWTRARRSGVPARLRPEHILASVALPLVFPAQKVGDQYFGDGSLRIGAPLSPAIHCGADKILVIGVQSPAQHGEAAIAEPKPGQLAGYLIDILFMDNTAADIELAERLDTAVASIPVEKRAEFALRDLDVQVIAPSQDLREIAKLHAHLLPWPVRMLMKRLGLWSSDGRLLSYLLFESAYCSALLDLGYRDAMARREGLMRFLA
jgi:NTE family protein